MLLMCSGRGVRVQSGRGLGRIPHLVLGSGLSARFLQLVALATAIGCSLFRHGRLCSIAAELELDTVECP